MERRAPVFTLGAPLGRLGADPRGPVCQDHRGLDLVAILAPGTASPRGSELALSASTSGSRAGGMAAVKAPGVVFPAGGAQCDRSAP